MESLDCEIVSAIIAVGIVWVVLRADSAVTDEIVDSNSNAFFFHGGVRAIAQDVVEGVPTLHG